MARIFRPFMVMALALAVAPTVRADEPGGAAATPSAREQELEDQVMARDDRIGALERQMQTLAGEMATMRTAMAVPEEPELTGSYGFGPAASKVYGSDRGLSLGGYGEAKYTHYVQDKGSNLNEADFLRWVLYLGYKFNENIVFNSEVEIEHGSTEEAGAVSVEFAALDFFWKKWLNVRAGLLLLPMGFINEVHEPPFFYGVNRPATDRTILPTTWREVGAGFFGTIGEDITYRTYLVNGFDGADFSSSGIRGGRQQGSEALAEDWAWVGRMDWTPSDDLVLGGSVYTGKSGQNQSNANGNLPDARLTLFETHAQFRKGQFHSRALFSMSFLGDAKDLTNGLNLGMSGDPSPTNPIADTMLGGYVEAAYDIWPCLFDETTRVLAPFLRVEYVDPQYRVSDGFVANRNKAYWLGTAGVNYKPHPNVVLKMEYRNFEAREGDIADELGFGLGYAF